MVVDMGRVSTSKIGSRKTNPRQAMEKTMHGNLLGSIQQMAAATAMTAGKDASSTEESTPKLANNRSVLLVWVDVILKKECWLGNKLMNESMNYCTYNINDH